MDYLIVGLGNPGSEYRTRHNMLGTVLKTPLLNKLIWKNKFKGEFSTFDIQGNKVVFLKPMTYMNLSGESVIACSKFLKFCKATFWLCMMK